MLPPPVILKTNRLLLKSQRLGKLGMRFKEKLSFKEGEDSLLFSNE